LRANLHIEKLKHLESGVMAAEQQALGFLIWSISMLKESLPWREQGQWA
jgi:hypothetical protein